MKKISLSLIMTFLIGVSLTISQKSNNSLYTSEEENLKIVYAEVDEGFICYSNMQQFTGGRTLECNTPCCYRLDYNPGQDGGKCKGSFSTCSD